MSMALWATAFNLKKWVKTIPKAKSHHNWSNLIFLTAETASGLMVRVTSAISRHQLKFAIKRFFRQKHFFLRFRQNATHLISLGGKTEQIWAKLNHSLKKNLRPLLQIGLNRGGSSLIHCKPKSSSSYYSWAQFISEWREQFSQKEKLTSHFHWFMTYS